MTDPQHAMLAYAKLAALAWRKGQLPGRDRFLILAGAAACRAGWPAVAARCRQLVVQHNPRHRLGRSPSLADALRDPDFQPLLHQLERFCGYERAEHLLRELDISPDPPADMVDSDAGAYALTLLADP